MKHFDFEIHLHIDGELPADKIEDMNLHLSNCERCRQVLADYQEIKKNINHFYEKFPEDMLIYLHQNASRKNFSLFNRPIFGKIPSVKILIPVSAAALIIFAFVVYWHSGSNEDRPAIKLISNSATHKEITKTGPNMLIKPEPTAVHKKHKIKETNVNIHRTETEIQYSDALKGNDFRLTFEQFNETINKAIASQYNSFANEEPILFICNGLELQNFNAIIDSTLHELNSRMSN